MGRADRCRGCPDRRRGQLHHRPDRLTDNSLHNTLAGVSVSDRHAGEGTVYCLPGAQPFDHHRGFQMAQINRRAFLHGAAAATGGVLVSGSLQELFGNAVQAAKPSNALSPVADLRDGVVRLHLPDGFQYRSFHDTDILAGTDPIRLTDGTLLPGRHDGMGAFPGPNGNVWLVRNHEINGPVAAAFGPNMPAPYDNHTGSGTTTVEVTNRGEVVRAFTSLNGTQMNCSGGRMPWGSWITCEETVNGPDVGPDFTGASNVTLEQRHGFIFEVPAGGQSNREPITSAGRFAHEAAAYSPDEG